MDADLRRREKSRPARLAAAGRYYRCSDAGYEIIDASTGKVEDIATTFEKVEAIAAEVAKAQVYVALIRALFELRRSA